MVRACHEPAKKPEDERHKRGPVALRRHRRIFGMLLLPALLPLLLLLLPMILLVLLLLAWPPLLISLLRRRVGGAPSGATCRHVTHWFLCRR